MIYQNRAPLRNGAFRTFLVHKNAQMIMKMRDICYMPVTCFSFVK